MTPDYIAFGNIFIDDIVLPDGRTFMATLGGASSHALIGMRIWAESLGIVAGVGPDLPDSFRRSLTGMGVDLQGIKTVADIKTTHAWQIFELNGHRTEIFRSEKGDFFDRALDFVDLPSAYYGAGGYHLYWARESAKLPGFIQKLRYVNPGAALVWEPAFHHLNPSPDDMKAGLPQVDHFSPDIDAAYSIAGADSAESALEKLLEWGAPSASIRMGAEGSLVGTAQGDWWHIPAVPAQVVDVTGAGNAYCGGLVVGLAQGTAPLEAALRGAVSASFAIEQFGIPDFRPTLRSEAESRLNWAREHTERLK